VTLPQPPRGVSPEGFWCEYVPRLWARVREGVPPLPLTVELEIVVGPESFALQLSPQGLNVKPGHARAAVARSVSSTEDFYAAVRDIVPTLLRQLEAVLPRLRAALPRFEQRMSRFDFGQLRSRPGRIDLELVDDAGDLHRAAYLVGTGTGPRVTVQITDNELRDLIRDGGRLSRLIGARIHAQGDVAYLVQLLAALEGSTTRSGNSP
jgi:hypothetical protein